MNAHQMFETDLQEELVSDFMLPDEDRFPKPPPDAMPGWHRRKRQEALQLLIRTCELWEVADRAGLMAVRDKLEPVIMHAHDAFVQVQEPIKTDSVQKKKR